MTDPHNDPTVAVVGLGYVGLPLAVAFGRRYTTVGFDTSSEKVKACQRGEDPARQVSADEIRAATGLTFSNDEASLSGASFVVVAVPTPVDDAHNPDLRPLLAASTTVGSHLSPGAIVVYESTVYPGATEEVCVPLLEQCSGLRWKTDFFVGYSPERVNPGDREHTLSSITKVVAGDSEATLDAVAGMYSSIISAGVYRASSIMVAEAAKVIENTQRDLNIALMNELAIIFHRLDIDTTEVLEAAGTKWNFLGFRPGLVGGHCIGVDPYYLTYKAERIGYNPQVILAGRRVNDGMAKFVAEQTVKMLIAADVSVNGAEVIILGVTFKENVPDIRNSKVIDLVRELRSFGIKASVHDPIALSRDCEAEYGESLVEWNDLPRASAIVAAVAHDEYQSMGTGLILNKLAPGGVFIDVKSAYDPQLIRASGARLWRM